MRNEGNEEGKGKREKESGVEWGGEEKRRGKHTWYRLMKLAISNSKVGMVPSTHDCAFKVGDEMQVACTVIFDGRTSVPE